MVGPASSQPRKAALLSYTPLPTTLPHLCETSMSDISRLLPDFPITKFSHLLPTLERNNVTASDLVVTAPADLAKRTRLPVSEVTKLSAALIRALQADIPIEHFAVAEEESEPEIGSENTIGDREGVGFGNDDTIDELLSGGIRRGYITEIVGESGSGKTLFCLHLLLAVAKRETRNAAIYLSTSAPLPTKRLLSVLRSAEGDSQISSQHREDGDRELHSAERSGSGDVNDLQPSTSTTQPDELMTEKEKNVLSRIHTMQVPDLESQNHILDYQLPLAAQRFNASLIILDAVPDNYKDDSPNSLLYIPASLSTIAAVPEDPTELPPSTALPPPSSTVSIGSTYSSTPSNTIPNTQQNTQQHNTQQNTTALRIRAAALQALSTQLRNLAISQNLAVVVVNHVSDRILPPARSWVRKSSDVVLSLDHQMRWFSGWGDVHTTSLSSQTQGEGQEQGRTVDGDGNPAGSGKLKTPLLGLVWSVCVDARIALIKERRVTMGSWSWKRRLKMVYAPWAPPGECEVEISEGGLKSRVKALEDRIANA